MMTQFDDPTYPPTQAYKIVHHLTFSGRLKMLIAHLASWNQLLLS